MCFNNIKNPHLTLIGFLTKYSIISNHYFLTIWNSFKAVGTYMIYLVNLLHTLFSSCSGFFIGKKIDLSMEKHAWKILILFCFCTRLIFLTVNVVSQILPHSRYPENPCAKLKTTTSNKPNEFRKEKNFAGNLTRAQSQVRADVLWPMAVIQSVPLDTHMIRT